MKLFIFVFIANICIFNSFISGFFLKENAKVLSNHHNNQEVFDLIDKVHKKCPDITYVYDLPLRTTKGLPLKVIAFSDNPKKHEFGEPEFKYVANMHGNEVIGREILLELMVQLCDEYLASNQNVMDLIQSTRLHLMPTMNPDGWDIAVNTEFEKYKKKFSSVKDMLREQGVTNWMAGRANGNNIDLNRNFPDLDVWEYKYKGEGKEKFDHLVMESTQEINSKHTDCQNKTFQPETLTVANWIVNNPFVLSANLHGGDFVVNYPYDDSKNHQTVYSGTPDDSLFKDIAYTFAFYHANMSDPNHVKCDMASSFTDGITNGAKWYPVCGGMQDYNYLSSNCFEVTIELGCDKFPAGKTLNQYWKDNMRSFYEFMWLSHIGIKGVVTYEGKPVKGANIIVARITEDGPEIIEHNIQSTETGEYWRLLNDDKYIVFAETNDGLRSEEIEITVVNDEFGRAAVLNLELKETEGSKQDSYENEKYMMLLQRLLEDKNQYDY